MTTNSKLRIGIIVSSLEVPAWINKAICGVDKSNAAAIELLIIHQCNRSRRPYDGKGGLLYSAYESLDRKLFGQTEPDAFKLGDLELPSGNVPMIATDDWNSGHTKEDADFSKIAGFGVDVLVNLSGAQLPDELANLSRYGIWEFKFGGDLISSNGWPYAEEIYRGAIYADSALVRQGHDWADSVTLYSSRAATHRYSLHRCRNPIYWKTSEFLARTLCDLHSKGWQYIIDHSKSALAHTEKSDIGFKPTGFSVLKFALTALTRYLRNRLLYFVSREQWSLACRQSLDHSGTFSELALIPGYTVADPIVDSSDGRTIVFYELQKLNEDKASIAYSTVSSSGKMSLPKIIIERDYHLSYPMIFDWRGDKFMIPETRGNKTIEMYYAESYPDKWVLDRVLFEGVNAVDTTILFHQGLIWLFTCMGPDGGSTRDELFLFYSDSLYGEWISHPMNPVVSDVGAARPAGRCFWRDGNLIRPSQDNSICYGYAVNFNRIDVITRDEYREKQVGRLTPVDLGRGSAVHTYDYDNGFAAIDIMSYVGKFSRRARAKRTFIA